MAASAAVPFLVAMMLLTGVCNTLLTKYQDMQCVHNCNHPDPRHHQSFQQPILQTLQMFIGEMGCWLVIGLFVMRQRYQSRKLGYEAIPTTEPATITPAAHQEDGGEVANPLRLVRGGDEDRIPLQGRSIWLLALPACCDITGTTLMNIGLLFVAASIYQMTRGALVLFVGLFSVWFLHHRLGLYKWFSLFVVVFGVAIVGFAGATARDGKQNPEQQVFDQGTVGALAQSSHAVMTVIGVLLIAGAQIFTATQFVLEERIMEKYAMEPIKVVGWEGVFGFVITLLVMLILHISVGTGYFNASEGLYQMTHFRSIAISSVLIMISIGGFNFFGLSVTRTVSATSRSTIDTCRTLFIWIVSLGLGWETFEWLQVAGFALLVYGTFLFNDLIRPPMQACVQRKPEPLLPEDPIEHH